MNERAPRFELKRLKPGGPFHSLVEDSCQVTGGLFGKGKTASQLWQPFLRMSSPIRNRTTVARLNTPATGQKDAVAISGRKAIIVEEKGVSSAEQSPTC